MKSISYITSLSIPLIIVIVVVYGVKEKKNVYTLFIEGVKDGMNVVIRLFPTLLAIFLAVGMIKNSGIIEWFAYVIGRVQKNNIFPAEIIPLAILKPISGSASIALGTDVMRTYGVDSKIGKIAATIMGSTETTLYIIAIYTSHLKIKKTRHILVPALIADAVGIIASIFICNIYY